MEYAVCPKLLGLAERAWTQQPQWARVSDYDEHLRLLEEGWNRFVNALGQNELPRLDYLLGGIRYRVPPPGAIIEDGLLKANTAYPGLTIRYTEDGAEPSMGSPVYSGPVRIEKTVKLKTFTPSGRGSRTTEVEP